MKIRLNEIFKTIALGRRYRFNYNFTLPIKKKEFQEDNNEIMFRTNLKTISYVPPHNERCILYKKCIENKKCQKNDNSYVEEQKVYVKKEEFYYSSEYIDSIDF